LKRRVAEVNFFEGMTEAGQRRLLPLSRQGEMLASASEQAMHAKLKEFAPQQKPATY
jgi:hypothetical protein